MSYSVRVALRERDQHPAPGHRGKIGRDPAQVVQVHVRRDDLEVVPHGTARPGDGPAAGEPGVGQRPFGEAEDQAVAPEPEPATVPLSVPKKGRLST